MKVIESGTIYKIYGEDLVVLDDLPAQTYKVCFGQFTGFFLEKQHDLEIKEDKIYGVHEEKANKVLDRFDKSRKNLGVILSGDKGIGKSLFARLLAQKAIKKGVPVIVIDNYIPGINDFLNKIKNEVLVLFDEFDKTFEIDEEDDPQSKMLSLFDGTSTGKKLFVITCNEYLRLNEYIINRPGRFHFYFRFEYPTDDEIREYLKDKLSKEYYSEIEKVVKFSKKVKLNYDCLSAIVFELNEGESFEESIKDLNIINTDDIKNRYDVTLYTEEGITFYQNSIMIDLFDNKSTSIWVEDTESNDVLVKFNGNNAVFDHSTRKFILQKDKFKITRVNCKTNELDEKYSNLHYSYVELSVIRNNNDYIF